MGEECLFIVTVIMVGGGVSGAYTVTRVMRRAYSWMHADNEYARVYTLHTQK